MLQIQKDGENRGELRRHNILTSCRKQKTDGRIVPDLEQRKLYAKSHTEKNSEDSPFSAEPCGGKGLRSTNSPHSRYLTSGLEKQILTREMESIGDTHK